MTGRGKAGAPDAPGAPIRPPAATLPAGGARVPPPFPVRLELPKQGRRRGRGSPWRPHPPPLQTLRFGCHGGEAVRSDASQAGPRGVPQQPPAPCRPCPAPQALHFGVPKQTPGGHAPREGPRLHSLMPDSELHGPDLCLSQALPVPTAGPPETEQEGAPEPGVGLPVLGMRTTAGPEGWVLDFLLSASPPHPRLSPEVRGPDTGEGPGSGPGWRPEALSPSSRGSSGRAGLPLRPRREEQPVRPPWWGMPEPAPQGRLQSGFWPSTE